MQIVISCSSSVSSVSFVCCDANNESMTTKMMDDGYIPLHGTKIYNVHLIEGIGCVHGDIHM